MAHICFHCRWFNPFFFDVGDDLTDISGLCGWPADRLLYSMRDANRERNSVTAANGSNCPCFEQKD